MIEQDIARIEAAAVLLIGVVRDIYGDTEYVYHALPVSWRRVRGRRGEHTTPITGLEQYETTKENWETHRDESRRLRTEAFMGRLHSSYTNYKRTVSKKGWREHLIGLLETEQL